LIDEALQPHRPGTLRRRTGSNLRTAPLTARGATRAPIRSGTRLYAYLCGASSTRELPAHSRPHSKPGPVSGPSAVCASTCDGLLRARAPSYSLPCGALRSSLTDAYDRLLLPTASLRAPALRQLPASLRGLRLALDSRACTHGQETGEPGVSRRLIRFGVPVRVGGVRHISPFAPERAMPLTPLSRPSLRAALSHERFGSGCQGRASRPSVKIERALRPRVPSIDR